MQLVRRFLPRLTQKTDTTGKQNSRFSAESGIFREITYLQFIHKLSKATL